MAETEQTASVRASPISVRALLALGAVAVVVYLADQLSKYWVVEHLNPSEPVAILGPVLHFFLVRNAGAAFSIASGSTWIFSIAAAAVTLFIVIVARKIRSNGWAILFGMLLGGTTGNLTDRLFRSPGFGVGHVIDFIQVAGFPAVFNIADSFIVASMGLFIILTSRGVGLNGLRTGRTSAKPKGATITGRTPLDDAQKEPQADSAAPKKPKES